MVEVAVIVTNALVALATIALTIITAADVEKDQQRTLRECIAALVRSPQPKGKGK